MQRLEVSGAVRLIYRSLGVKGLKYQNSEVRHPRCVGTIAQKFCVLHLQSNTTIFHLVVQ